MSAEQNLVGKIEKEGLQGCKQQLPHRNIEQTHAFFYTRKTGKARFAVVLASPFRQLGIRPTLRCNPPPRRRS